MSLASWIQFSVFYRLHFKYPSLSIPLTFSFKNTQVICNMEWASGHVSVNHMSWKKFKINLFITKGVRGPKLFSLDILDWFISDYIMIQDSSSSNKLYTIHMYTVRDSVCSVIWLRMLWKLGKLELSSFRSIIKHISLKLVVSVVCWFFGRSDTNLIRLWSIPNDLKNCLSQLPLSSFSCQCNQHYYYY